MSLILCPECGAKISDRATQCPHCGFQSENFNLPISQQDTFEACPAFEYDIEGWEVEGGSLNVISYEDNKNFFNVLGKWKNIQTKLPAIADVILSMAKKEHIMVADMDKYIKKLIDKGVYRFTIDKNGEILPTIRDAKNIVKQVRLKEMTLMPNLNNALNNLYITANLTTILDEIKYIGESIREIHIELQNDRLASAESAQDKLKQALKIQDSKLREKAMLDVISSATDAKRLLMRNFSQNMQYVKDHYKQLKKSDSAAKASDALQSLIAITNSVQTECYAYAALGEYEPCKVCLDEFKDFILDCKLDERDTLLQLNECVAVKKDDVVNKFSEISQKITSFDPSSQIETQLYNFLTTNEEKGDDNNEE